MAKFSISRGALVAIVLVGLFYMPKTVRSTPDTSYLTHLCNTAETYPLDGPYSIRVAFVLVDLTSATHSSPGYVRNDASPYDAPIVKGHATCNIALEDSNDCASCLQVAKKLMIDMCPLTLGAEMILKDCSIKYGQ